MNGRIGVMVPKHRQSLHQNPTFRPLKGLQIDKKAEIYANKMTKLLMVISKYKGTKWHRVSMDYKDWDRRFLR